MTKRKSQEKNASDDDVTVIEQDKKGNTSDRTSLLVDMSNKLSSMEKKMNQMLNVVNTQNKKITKLEGEVKELRVENQKLQEELKSCKEITDELAQRSRMNNIIINGIRQEKNEDIYKVVEGIGLKLGIADPLKDVQVAHRVGTTREDKVKPIVVRLPNTSTRDKWTSAFRKKQFYKEKWYVNEHLTKRNQSLLSKSKDFKKANNFKFVWVKDCKVLIRKDEKARIYAIRCEQDLERIINPDSYRSPTMSDTTEDYNSASSNF
uniref:FP protein C-terminal domain-containing protein n=1 Tax=Cacopsylla melanoneura TaxID=428564 RepID=A0A8D8Z569_9HEMI